MAADLDTTAGSIGWENAPKHYQGGGGLESFDVWDDFRLDPYLANAFKYFSRWDKKGSPLNDLKKGLHYLLEAKKRWDATGWLHWHRARAKLDPQEVVEAFSLGGNVATAVSHLLWHRSGYQPGPDLEAAIRYAERAVKEYEAAHA